MTSDEQEQSLAGGNRVRHEISSGANTPEAGKPKSRIDEVNQSEGMNSRTEAGSSDR